MLIAGRAARLASELAFTGEAQRLPVTWHRYRYVRSQAGPLPDPLVPLTGRFDVPPADEKHRRPDPRQLAGRDLRAARPAGRRASRRADACSRGTDR